MALAGEIRRNNSRLLYLTSDWLNQQSSAISADEVRALAAECSVDQAEAYALLLAGLYDIDAAGADKAFFHGWLRPMLRLEDPARYERDPYYQHIRIQESHSRHWDLRTQQLAPYAPFVCDDLRQEADGRVLPQIAFFPRAFSYPAVLEDGREWMTLLPNETCSIQPALKRAQGKVLTYGLGLGYFTYMALAKNTVASLTVVERDPEVLALFRAILLPQFPHQEKLRLVEADAFAYASQQAPAEQYDFVFADIWHDVGDGLPLYARFRSLEVLSPQTAYCYWLEPTLRCYLDDNLWAE